MTCMHLQHSRSNLGFEPARLRFRIHNLFDQFLKWVQPQKVWIIIFSKVQKGHLIHELICFSTFLYHYIDFSIFLEVVRRGAIAPLAPPK